MTDRETRKNPPPSHSSPPPSPSIALDLESIPIPFNSNSPPLDWIEGVLWLAHPVTLHLQEIGSQIEAITHYPLNKFEDNPHFWLDLIHPQDRASFEQQLTRLSQQSLSILKLRYRILNRTGQIQWVQTQVRLLTVDRVNADNGLHSESMLQGFTTTVYPCVDFADPLESLLSGIKPLLSSVLTQLPHVAIVILDRNCQEVLRMGELWQTGDNSDEFDPLIQCLVKAKEQDRPQTWPVGDRLYQGSFWPGISPESIPFGFILIQEIAHSEQKYKTLFDLLPIGIVFTDEQGKFLEINPAAETILGVPKDKIEQWSCETFEQVIFFSEAEYDRQKNQHYEAGILSSSGEMTWLQLDVYPMALKGYGNILSYSDITAQKLVDLALTKQAEREKLMRIITQKIRQSLNLQEILETTVSEVRLILNSDRAIIYRFNSDTSGVVMAESCRLGIASMLGWKMSDLRTGSPESLKHYCQGKIQVIEDISKAGLDFSYCQLLKAFQVQAQLSVPIILTALPNHNDRPFSFCHLEDEAQKSHYLWGLLIVHECDISLGKIAHHKHWKQLDIDLLKQLAAQVAIAIDQSFLYQQLEKANQELYGLATSDGLTQLANRRHFDQSLHQEWQRLTREKQPLSLILCDIDFFKRYNDTYGHQAGDDCLKQVAITLKKVVKRPADLVARYGGEEFVVMLPNTPASGAISMAQAIQKQVQALQILHHNSSASSVVTLSLGIATSIPCREMEPLGLLKSADEALYQAKAQGRNQWVYANQLTINIKSGFRKRT
ncbi:diguanylate cyclase [Roseofilum sp. BLCC_M154]|uniref:Diguanylate cyclase n=1 Tax=Roseofilum acuticapitatum BLCC-M154 TaxID=3022444 RepID=A0ABT7AXD6_9CYAN|nr:diguanylate cyclase [Roseofilum acuticapitatum]MDJ1171579.1 diguanylate cyclase [Roseofilum acuticapitatum BLCC-M154]